MRKKHIPARTCIGCRTVREQRQLVRIVRGPDGMINVDSKGKMPGRGAYVCSDQTCLDQALQGGKLERSFKCRISDATKEALIRHFQTEDC